jgi:hypothetical protein
LSNCREHDRLAAEVEQILNELAEKTTLLLELFRSKSPTAFARLDKELELLVGKKERAVGALRQHAKDHDCGAAA